MSLRPFLPGPSARFMRSAHEAVALGGPDDDGIRQDFEHLRAISVRHQIDHLNRRMVFGRISRTKRGMLPRKSKTLAR